MTEEIQPLRVEVYQDGVMEWRWRTRCPNNGKKLAMSSEGYKHKAHCVAMLQRHLGADVQFREV